MKSPVPENDAAQSRRSEELLGAIIQGTVAVTGTQFFRSLVRHLAQGLHVRWVFVAECLPNLRARLAQMQIAVDTQAAFLDHATRQMENPGPNTLMTILESKAAAAEAALQVTDLAMRTCGGAAFSKPVSVERNFREARAGAVMAPTTDVLHEFIGRALLEMPLF